MISCVIPTLRLSDIDLTYLPIQNPSLQIVIVTPEKVFSRDWVKILDKYSNVVVITAEKKGVYNAYNIGLSAAKGKYIYFKGATDKLYYLNIEDKFIRDVNSDLIIFGLNILLTPLR